MKTYAIIAGILIRQIIKFLALGYFFQAIAGLVAYPWWFLGVVSFILWNLWQLYFLPEFLDNVLSAQDDTQRSYRFYVLWRVVIAQNAVYTRVGFSSFGRDLMHITVVF